MTVNSSGFSRRQIPRHRFLGWGEGQAAQDLKGGAAAVAANYLRNGAEKPQPALVSRRWHGILGAMIRLPLRTLTLLPVFAISATLRGELPPVPPTSAADRVVVDTPAGPSANHPADNPVAMSGDASPTRDAARSMELVWNLGESSAWEHCLVYDTETGEPTIDPACFLEMVVERYRTLVFYRDRARVVRIISTGDEPPRRVETRVDSTLVDGELNIRTPQRQLAGAIVSRLPFRSTPKMQEVRRKYDTWLAPHMALAQSDDASGTLSVGGGEHVSITDAGAAMIDDRPLVHLELTTEQPGQADEEPHAKTRLDLYVDPGSPGVARIEGHRDS